ncbi:MAG: hypothetical protein ACI841_001204 [Planctomycetota bacterium]|jgi:hypothetical protein
MKILHLATLACPLVVPSHETQASDLGAGLELAKAAAPDSILYVESRGLSGLLRRGLADPLILAIREHDVVQAALGQLEAGPEAALAFGSVMFGRPILPALAGVCDQGVALSIQVGGKNPSWCLTMLSSDQSAMRDVLEAGFELVRSQNNMPDDSLHEPELRIGDAEIWSLGEMAIALRGNLFIAARDTDAVRACLQRTSGEAASLASSESFQAARAVSEPDSFLWAWFDMELGRATGNQKRNIEEFIGSPAVAFLFGSSMTEYGSAESVSAALDWNEGGLAFTAHALGEDNGHRVLMPNQTTESTPLPGAGSRELGRALLYRNFADIFAERTELFPPQTLPAFAEALTGLALLFGGADVSDEILPHLDPWLGLIVDDAVFAKNAIPETPLPAAAIVARLKDAESLGPRLIGAFQTAIGLANVDRAQQMMPPMILGLKTAGGTTITQANFLAPRSGEGVDLQYNLVPACACVADRFIIGTHVSLVERLVKRIEAGDMQEADSAAESLRLQGAAIAGLIAANQDSLTMQGVLEDGKSETQSRQDIQGLEALARILDRVEVRMHRPSADHTRIELELTISRSAR